MIAPLLSLLCLAGGGAGVSQRVDTPEGWYQVEGLSGEPEVAFVIAALEPEAPEGDAPAPPSEQRLEIERMLAVDCVEARGRYLERVLQLHGLNAFSLEPRALEAWTHRRPPPQVAPFGFSAALGDPALAILYGEPPVPPGSLSSDFTLQSLARDILQCDSADLSPGPARLQAGGPSAE